MNHNLCNKYYSTCLLNFLLLLLRSFIFVCFIFLGGYSISYYCSSLTTDIFPSFWNFIFISSLLVCDLDINDLDSYVCFSIPADSRSCFSHQPFFLIQSNHFLTKNTSALRFYTILVVYNFPFIY